MVCSSQVIIFSSFQNEVRSVGCRHCSGGRRFRRHLRVQQVGGLQQAGLRNEVTFCQMLFSLNAIPSLVSQHLHWTIFFHVAKN